MSNMFRICHFLRRQTPGYFINASTSTDSRSSVCLSVYTFIVNVVHFTWIIMNTRHLNRGCLRTNINIHETMVWKLRQSACWKNLRNIQCDRPSVVKLLLLGMFPWDDTQPIKWNWDRFPIQWVGGHASRGNWIHFCCNITLKNEIHIHILYIGQCIVDKLGRIPS